METNLDPNGAPFHDLLGIRLIAWDYGFARLACIAGPQHRNRSCITHGGLILSMIDQAGAPCRAMCAAP